MIAFAHGYTRANQGFDSSALVAILRDEPDVLLFAEAIGAANSAIVSAVNCFETSMVLAGAAHSDTVWLPLDAEARFVRAAFINYGKRRHRAAFNFGDCAAYALAKSRNIPVLYNGADFAKTDVASAL